MFCQFVAILYILHQVSDAVHPKIPVIDTGINDQILSVSNFISRNTVMPIDKNILWDVAVTSRMLLDYIEIHLINEVSNCIFQLINDNTS